MSSPALPAPDGSFNFRDLGGWPAADGGCVRTGIVYRSGELDGLTEAGWRQLADLGIETVYDLRGDQELAPGTRSAAEAGIRLHRVPMWGAGGPFDAGGTFHAAGVTMPGLVTRYAEEKVRSYARMVEMFAAGFGTVISGLACSGRPALFHCAAGKDRTGLLAALILRLLGVSEGDVLTDYLASREGTPVSRVERYLPQLRAVGADEAAFIRINAAYPPALLGALRRIEDRWGSVGRYLTARAGIVPEEIAALRRSLVAAPHSRAVAETGSQ